jgi:hypothetical protein
MTIPRLAYAALLALVVSGCVSQTQYAETTTTQIEETTTTRTAPPSAVAFDNGTIIFRLYDTYANQQVNGMLLCPNRTFYDIGVGNHTMPKAAFSNSEYAIVMRHMGTEVFMPLNIDLDRLDLIRNASEYTVRFDSRELNSRFFQVFDQDSNALQGILRLDNVTLGSTDRDGIVSVDYGLLHPGTLMFIWYDKDRAAGSWELTYLEKDMRYLYLRIPVNNAG